MVLQRRLLQALHPEACPEFANMFDYDGTFYGHFTVLGTYDFDSRRQ